MHAQGFHDKALEIFEDALKIAEKLEDESGSVLILANLAVVNSSKGDFDKAFTLTKQASALSKESNSQINYVHIDFNESHWNYEIGNFDKAMNMLDRLEKRLEDSAGDAWQGSVSFVKGSCEFSRGDYDTSKQLFLDHVFFEFPFIAIDNADSPSLSRALISMFVCPSNNFTNLRQSSSMSSPKAQANVQNQRFRQAPILRSRN